MTQNHPFESLPPRGKRPTTVRTLEAWIQQAEGKVGIGARRVGWMVASGIVIAALQRITHSDGKPHFLIKGGTYLELLLGLRARATRDVDTLFRGSFDDFLSVLDNALEQPFGEIAFRRTEPEAIRVPGRRVKPIRLDILLQLRGKTWRRIPVEISPDEGNAGARAKTILTPSLAHFGIDMPPTISGLVIDYQVAQKIHACTDPHSEERPNDRVRDVVDLLLLKQAFYSDDTALSELAAACRDLFQTRLNEANLSEGILVRAWPPLIMALHHWNDDYPGYAKEVGIHVELDEVVGILNTWIDEIERQG